MWFTLDGKRLEKGISGVGGRLFPVVGLEHNVVLETRFKKPFFSDDVTVAVMAREKVGERTETTQETVGKENVADGVNAGSESAWEEHDRKEPVNKMNTVEVQVGIGAERENDETKTQGTEDIVER